MLDLNSGQRRGAIVIFFGFLIATFAGLFLSVSGLPTGQLLTFGGLAFLILSPVFIFGVYTYVNSSLDDAGITEMEQQRKMLTIIQQRGSIQVGDLADELSIPVERIKPLIDDLSRLELFSGILIPDDGMIIHRSSSLLKSMTHCENCRQPISIGNAPMTICPHCATEYHTP